MSRTTIEKRTHGTCELAARALESCRDVSRPKDSPSLGMRRADVTGWAIVEIDLVIHEILVEVVGSFRWLAGFNESSHDATWRATGLRTERAAIVCGKPAPPLFYFRRLGAGEVPRESFAVEHGGKR
jgi:hypothetical protein